jgi:hypothetical protein
VARETGREEYDEGMRRNEWLEREREKKEGMRGKREESEET